MVSLVTIAASDRLVSRPTKSILSTSNPSFQTKCPAYLFLAASNFFFFLPTPAFILNIILPYSFSNLTVGANNSSISFLVDHSTRNLLILTSISIPCSGLMIPLTNVESVSPYDTVYPIFSTSPPTALIIVLPSPVIFAPISLSYNLAALNNM